MAPNLTRSQLPTRPLRPIRRASVVGAALLVLSWGREIDAAPKARLAVVVARVGDVEPQVTQGLVVKIGVALAALDTAVVPPRELGELPSETDPFLAECLDDDRCLVALADSLKQAKLVLLVVEGSGASTAARLALVEPPGVRRASRLLSEDPLRTLPQGVREMLEGLLAEAVPRASESRSDAPAGSKSKPQERTRKPIRDGKSATPVD